LIFLGSELIHDLERERMDPSSLGTKNPTIKIETFSEREYDPKKDKIKENTKKERKKEKKKREKKREKKDQKKG
jgi:hypothetical protein